MSKPTPHDNFKPCSVEGCKNDAQRKASGRRGLCCAHYTRWMVHGDPLAGRTPYGTPLTWIDEKALTHVGSECLPWPFAKLPSGYGTVHINCKTAMAHRYVCQRAHGAPPSKRHHAAHDCGNQQCVNPRHLSWKTGVENEADKIPHGTVAKGRRNGWTKLSEADVREIRRLSGSATLSKIGQRFGVNKTTVYKILSGESWGWLT